MSKLFKFFKKKQIDAQFGMLGAGRSLTEPPKNINCSQSLSQETHIERPSPSESESKAGEAALSRCAAKKIKPKTAARYLVEAEIENTKKQIEEAEALAAKYSVQTINIDKPEALKRVLFGCPSLFGNDFVGSYSEVNAAIDKYLMDESVNNPHEASCLILMRGIEASQFPPGINETDESTCSLQEIREKRRQNFTKIIRNLIDFPDKEAYRRLRISNKLINDLLTVKGAAEFFKACGFIRTDSSGVQFEEVQDKERSEDEFLVLSVSTDAQQDHLKTMLSLIEMADPPMPKLNRDTTVLKATGASVRPLTRDELPAEYFYISRDDLKRMVDAQQKAIEEGGVLLTKTLRERLKTRERRIYRYVLLRVRLPGELIIQGTFLATETIGDVREWICSCLIDQSITYKLWAPPGQPMPGRPMTARVCLDDFVASSLVELNLAPCSLLTVSLENIQIPLTLRPDLASVAQSLS